MISKEQLKSIAKDHNLELSGGDGCERCCCLFKYNGSACVCYMLRPGMATGLYFKSTGDVNAESFYNSIKCAIVISNTHE